MSNDIALHAFGLIATHLHKIKDTLEGADEFGAPHSTETNKAIGAHAGAAAIALKVAFDALWPEALVLAVPPPPVHKPAPPEAL